MERTEERVSELEDIAVEITHPEKQRKSTEREGTEHQAPVEL